MYIQVTASLDIALFIRNMVTDLSENAFKAVRRCCRFLTLFVSDWGKEVLGWAVTEFFNNLDRRKTFIRNDDPVPNVVIYDE